MSDLISQAADPTGFDPRSRSFRADPYPIYSALRSIAPVYRRKPEGDWLVTRYQDVDAILKNRDFGRADQSAVFDEKATDNSINPLQKMRAQSFEIMAGWTVLQNPPQHSSMRNRMRHHFDADHLQFYDDVARKECSRRLSVLPANGLFDLVGDVAFPIALRVNAAILGIAPQDFSPHLRAWTDRIALLTDLDPSFLSREQGLVAISAVAGYFRKLLHGRISPERPGLIDHLATDQRDGQLSETQVLSTLVFIFAVGHSSTVNLIGNAVLTLLRHPKQLDRLREDPRLLESALSEVLRYESPVQSIARTALVDADIDGTTIKRGEKVHLQIGAANRDPARFPDPDVFDIGRDQTAHLSFGAGLHTCIGLKLAKATAMTTLARLFHSISVGFADDEQPDWDEPYVGRGLKSLALECRRIA